jgi:hypothetical protein
MIHDSEGDHRQHHHHGERHRPCEQADDQQDGAEELDGGDRPAPGDRRMEPAELGDVAGGDAGGSAIERFVDAARQQHQPGDDAQQRISVGRDIAVEPGQRRHHQPAFVDRLGFLAHGQISLLMRRSAE